MKAFIIAAVLGVTASQGADCAYAQSGPEPRGEFRDIQADVLRTERAPVDASMKITDAETTTNFGYEPQLDGLFTQVAAEDDSFYISDYTER